MPGDATAAALFAQLEAEQARLRGLLTGWSEPDLAQRPPDGNWSVVENVRHLVYAEQRHLRRVLPGWSGWSPLGRPPTGLEQQKQLRVVDWVPEPTAAEVLEAWAKLHEPARLLADDDREEVHRALERNLHHLRIHIRVVERLLGHLEPRDQPPRAPGEPARARRKQ